MLSEVRANPAAPDLVHGFDVDTFDELADRVVSAVEGDRLVHTDLHEHQFLIGPGGIHVIDLFSLRAPSEEGNDNDLLAPLVSQIEEPKSEISRLVKEKINTEDEENIEKPGELLVSTSEAMKKCRRSGFTISGTRRPH